ncbi:AraC family transcriptional regulator of adaptative response / methylphosphotriester-DNA alkyltransferase methyltransferase [Scopulibacillus darangshiensis]|uniref:AraC family transcriptional regulator of adaptative response / methylphosphotriester-DNA alkyltransferase methyltransferase n=1 Tax=Scopulibacillus darangshiensis TaxID=442528 RepID=A0A4R2NJC4_9BACL|nr:bifunctional transcriptional activator/DNA repair enzyme AdaA [Scopulibacillus darangshiensis]TCP21325.1 AraC family transcriptional regulator of adaptative response / methylphosphotriester-DNA alkyltransferase methyltransferase [Scopulibacillus darangshiensis]
MTSSIPDDYWKAIVENDSAYDNTFYYAVKTTGIFCRPSCKSKVPNKENVRIFKNADLAQSESFRPCKRCKPNGLDLPDEEWIQALTEWIDKNYSESLTLDTLAEVIHGSPYHLQRTFKRIKGMSPTEYIQHVRIAKAAHCLEITDETVTNIGSAIGYPNTAYFVTLFKRYMKQTPADYRKTQGRLKEDGSDGKKK